MRLPTKYLPDLERIAVDEAMKDTGDHVERAAKILGWHPSTLYRKLKQYSVQDAAVVLHPERFLKVQSFAKCEENLSGS